MEVMPPRAVLAEAVLARVQLARRMLHLRVRCVLHAGGGGQGTVEFALVAAAFLSLAIGLGALASALQDGLLLEHALASASHQVQGGSAGTLADLFLY